MRIWERIKTGWRSAGRMVGRAIAAIDTTRRVGTSLFLLVSIGLGLWLVLVAGKPRVEDGSVLVMALKGPLVDEDTAGWRDRLAAQLQGRDSGKVSLRDLSETLDRAAGDDRIGINDVHPDLVLTQFRRIQACQVQLSRLRRAVARVIRTTH